MQGSTELKRMEEDLRNDPKPGEKMAEACRRIAEEGKKCLYNHTCIFILKDRW